MSSHRWSFLEIKQGRDYGIDLLRILAMFMVVVLHVLGQGGVLEAEAITPVNFWTAWFLEIATYGAVDIYALISGYVGYQVKHKYAGIAELWLRVLLYSVAFTVADKIFYDPSIGKKRIIYSMFIITKGGLWYFSMYFGLFFLIPILNTAIEYIDKKSLRNVFATSVFLFSVLPFLWDQDTFKTKAGYSLLWLMIMYLIGAYIGKYHVLENIKKPVAFLGYLGCVAVTWCSKYFITNYFPSFMGHTNNANWLVNYTSLPVLLSALFLLFLFRDLDLPAVGKKIVAVIAPLTFSVYVIHLRPLIFDHFILNQFTSYASLSPAIMVLAVLGTAAVIFLACAALDFVRARIFDLLKVKSRLLRIEEKLHSKIG